MGGVEFVAAVCPRCGADLKIPENLTKAHCVFCGAEVIISGVQSSQPAQKVKCRACNGFGRLDLCSACGGRGTCSCNGGYCSACGGHGSIVQTAPFRMSTCPACFGSGRCPNCRGTTKCTACNGLGMIPSPTGSVKCSVCGTVGYVDIDKADGGTNLDKCPSCGKPWPGGGDFCAYCGHTKNCPRCGVLWPSNAVFCQHCGYRKSSRR
jgi:predicted RNA-binding Zn-ribbon protein involved in translation (DUF1610 family)